MREREKVWEGVLVRLKVRERERGSYGESETVWKRGWKKKSEREKREGGREKGLKDKNCRHKEEKLDRGKHNLGRSLLLDEKTRNIETLKCHRSVTTGSSHVLFQFYRSIEVLLSTRHRHLFAPKNASFMRLKKIYFKPLNFFSRKF